LCAYGTTNETNVSKSALSIDENLFILQALDAQQYGKFADAASLFEKLYAKSGQEEYLKSSIRLFLMTNNFSAIDGLIQKGFENYPQDFEYERFNIAKLIKENNITAAQKASIALLEKERNEQNLKLVGSIFLYMQEYNSSLNYFNEAYNISKSEQLLVQIADIELRLGKVDEAILRLETYTRMNGCSVNSCHKLVEIYGAQKNTNKMLDVYKRLYEKFEGDDYAQKIFEILMFQSKRFEAIGFLEKSKYKPDILIELYTVEKQYDKAVNLANETYKKTGNLEYLSKIAILEYESANNKTDALLNSVTDKFEDSLSSKSDALYLNYYGYLLINHDIDVSKGIDFVKKALQNQPDSPYYQDSLAWGFYKQKNCKDAYDIMQKVVGVLKDKEVLEHYDLIKECIAENKKVEK
jgi:predicted Zn-dependent protease